jgi:hypothetical protein
VCFMLLQVRQPLQRVQSTYALRAYHLHLGFSNSCGSSSNGAPDAFIGRKYAVHHGFSSSSSCSSSSSSSNDDSPDAFLYRKYADNLSDLQHLVRTIARLKGSSRASQVVPREVVTAFSSRFSSLGQADKQALLKSIAHTFTLTPAAVSAAHQRYTATAAETSPAKVKRELFTAYIHI